MTEYWIVWNEARNEGVIFEDEKDAQFASTGKQKSAAVSTLADAFCRDIYPDEKRSRPTKLSIPTKRNGEG